VGQLQQIIRTRQVDLIVVAADCLAARNLKRDLAGYVSSGQQDQEYVQHQSDYKDFLQEIQREKEPKAKGIHQPSAENILASKYQDGVNFDF
jgi:hypothetical protein